MSKPAHVRDYSSYLWDEIEKEKARQEVFLSGLFTSKYADQFYLHYLCPLCHEQLNVTKKLGIEAGKVTVDYQTEVAGRMLNQMCELLAEHYTSACGTTPERRKGMANILISKLQHEVYS